MRYIMIVCSFVTMRVCDVVITTVCCVFVTTVSLSCYCDACRYHHSVSLLWCCAVSLSSQCVVIVILCRVVQSSPRWGISGGEQTSVSAYHSNVLRCNYDRVVSLWRHCVVCYDDSLSCCNHDSMSCCYHDSALCCVVVMTVCHVIMTVYSSFTEVNSINWLCNRHLLK
jgi:hypothetical protein